MARNWPQCRAHEVCNAARLRDGKFKVPFCAGTECSPPSDDTATHQTANRRYCAVCQKAPCPVQRYWRQLSGTLNSVSGNPARQAAIPLKSTSAPDSTWETQVCHDLRVCYDLLLHCIVFDIFLSPSTFASASFPSLCRSLPTCRLSLPKPGRDRVYFCPPAAPAQECRTRAVRRHRSTERKNPHDFPQVAPLCQHASAHINAS